MPERCHCATGERLKSGSGEHRESKVRTPLRRIFESVTRGRTSWEARREWRGVRVDVSTSGDGGRPPTSCSVRGLAVDLALLEVYESSPQYWDARLDSRSLETMIGCHYNVTGLPNSYSALITRAGKYAFATCSVGNAVVAKPTLFLGLSNVALEQRVQALEDWPP